MNNNKDESPNFCSASPQFWCDKMNSEDGIRILIVLPQFFQVFDVDGESHLLQMRMRGLWV